MRALRRLFPKALAIAVSFALLPAGAEAKAKPKKTTVECKDGTTSKAGRGACSHHGGVAGPAKDESREQSAAPAPRASSAPQRETSRPQGRAAPRSERATSTPEQGQPTARCKDGSMSYAKQHSGACSHHGGVAEWLQ